MIRESKGTTQVVYQKMSQKKFTQCRKEENRPCNKRSEHEV